MTKAPLLQQLYRQHSAPFGTYSALENLVISYLDGVPFDEAMLTEVCSSLPLLQGKETEKDSPLTALQEWRCLLSLLLMLKDVELLDSVRTELGAYAHLLSQKTFWPTFQLPSMYRVLTTFLLEGRRPLLKPGQLSEDSFQMASGAAPLEYGDYWPWGQVPHPRFHAELGMLWACYALLAEDLLYEEAAKKLAHWQFHTLDHQYSPFVGLYSREEDVSESALLINNALLFRFICGFKADTDYAFLEQRQLEHLEKLSQGSFVEVPLYIAVFDRWLERQKKPSQVSIASPERALSAKFHPLKDESLALIGCRLDDCSAVSTLTGGGTGMGCFHAGEVRIVNYGPQLASTIGDCRGFGIQNSNPGQMERTDNSYTIQGISCVAPYPDNSDFESHGSFRLGQHSGFWIDSTQTFEIGKLTIDAKFYGVRDIHELAFVFFVKAKECTVGDGRIVKPRSFDRYRGNISPLVMHSNSTSVSILPQSCTGEMQVIPLGGEGAFWGADFLVAYLLDKKIHKWELHHHTKAMHEDKL